jgi:hypothetical protein
MRVAIRKYNKSSKGGGGIFSSFSSLIGGSKIAEEVVTYRIELWVPSLSTPNSPVTSCYLSDRRYKEFKALYAALRKGLPAGVAIPPLPDFELLPHGSERMWSSDTAIDLDKEGGYGYRQKSSNSNSDSDSPSPFNNGKGVHDQTSSSPTSSSSRDTSRDTSRDKEEEKLKARRILLELWLQHLAWHPRVHMHTALLEFIRERHERSLSAIAAELNSSPPAPVQSRREMLYLSPKIQKLTVEQKRQRLKHTGGNNNNYSLSSSSANGSIHTDGIWSTYTNQLDLATRDLRTTRKDVRSLDRAMLESVEATSFLLQVRT